MINRRVSLFYRYPLKTFHHMVCPCTLVGVCVVCPGTSELVGQQSFEPSTGLIRSTISSMVLSMPSMFSRMFLNLRNSDPCIGLVKKSPIISPVGQYLMDTSPDWIRSFTKKYLTLICFVLLLLEALPFVSRRMALLLSWYITFSLTWYPWASRKFRVHNA